MAHHVVDRRAHTFGETLVVQIGGNGVVLDAVVVHPGVNFLRCNARADVFAHVIEDANVHRRAFLDGSNVRRGFHKRTRKNFFTLTCQHVKPRIKRRVTLFVLCSRAAPTGIIAARIGHSIIHSCLQNCIRSRSYAAC